MKRLRYCVGPILLLILVLISGGGCSDRARASRFLKEANRDFDAEKYDDAEIEYKNALRLIRINPTAVGQLGRIYAMEGRMSDAAYCLRIATGIESNNIPFQLALGQACLSFRDSTNAAKIARRILAAQPTNEEALLLLVETPTPVQELRQEVERVPHAAANPAFHVALGMLATREQKFTEAANQLHLALVANPKSSHAYFALADLYSRQKEEKEMGQALQNAAAFAPLRSFMRIKYSDYLVRSGSVEKAWKVLQELTDKAPDFVPGWVSMMNLATGEKKLDDAAKFADAVLARDDKNYEALLCRGNVSLAKGDSGKAVMQFERMESIYKKSPQVKFQLAVAYLSAHDKIKCMENLNQALALDPGFSQAALFLAQLDIRLGDPAAAVALLNRFIKKDPNVGQAYMYLADAYLALRKPDSAIAVYRNLSEALPKNPLIPLQMGNVLAGQHRLSEARAAFEACLVLAPDYLQAVQQLINLDLLEHNYNDATALAEAQISKTPKAAEPWELMAKIEVAQTNLPQAETALVKAIELNPDLPGPYILLAQVYVLGTNYQPALQKLNALVARTNDMAAYLQIGAIQERLSNYVASCAAYEKVLPINPKSIPALNNLAYIYAVRLNKVDEAYGLAQKARALLPYDPQVEDTLGWILFKKGDYPRALTMLADSAEKTGGDAEVEFHLGMTHYMMDEEESARVALQRATAPLQDYADKAEARNALAVLNMDTAKAGASALTTLEKALQDHPNDPVILNHIGMLQEQEGAMEKAAATYETALKKNPDAVHIMAKLARLYESRLNQPEKALNLANEAHKLAPDSAEVNGVLGRLVFRNGDFGWAVSLLENASDRISNQPELLYDLAWAYYGVGRIADAETTMQKALQGGAGFIESEDAKRFVALVDAFNNPSKVQSLTGQAQKILQADAKYVPALMVSGVAEERAGNFKAAQDAYDKALGVFPKFVPAARLLAILDSKHFTDDSHGCEWAEKARNAYPDDPEVTKSLAILSYYQTKYPRSAEILQSTIAGSRDDGELYYYLGMDYFQLKQRKESKQALAKALALKIPDKLAAEAKRTLEELK
jgi:tetratricopeptide (TPR) repeat protein